MSEEFKFEDRYIVIKRADVERFWRDDVRDQFMAALDRLNEHNVRIPQRQYLVIESDWPEFYPAFQMIEARVNGKPTELEVLRAQLANTEQSRRSFFDLSQDLEKKLVDRDAALNQAYMALIGYLPGHRNDLTDAAIAACSAVLFPVEAKAACSHCGGWGHIETEDSAHDCPECGPSVIERAVEAGVMNAPAKPKTCIECDQPYCHGVCVERGDQGYDRDQAAKGPLNG